jgi:hypothetical protein
MNSNVFVWVVFSWENDLFHDKLGAYATLSTAISASATPPFDISVDSTVGFDPPPSTFYIDGEKLAYDSMTATTFHVSGRALEGTTPGDHAMGNYVTTAVGQSGEYTGVKTDGASIRPRVAGALVHAGPTAGDRPHIVNADMVSTNPGTKDNGCWATENPDICYSRRNAENPSKVSGNGAGDSDYPAVASFDDGWVHVVWQEKVGSFWQIHYAAHAETDSEPDGMPDAFEAARPCLTVGEYDATQNPDNDGIGFMRNLEEYWSGTSPCDYDTDDDGCADGEEMGPSESLGGRRNALNFWDFFDVPTGPMLVRDQAVSVADQSAIVARFGSSGDAYGDPLSTPAAPPAYHTSYDRSPLGPDAWDLGPANGSITIQDLTLAIAQFSHSCIAPP